MAEMGVHLFQVVNLNNAPLLELLLQQIAADPIEGRLRVIGRHEVRLEDITPPRTGTNTSPYWLLDFTRLRFEHGPAKAGRQIPAQGFTLGQDEGFGEETAALYDPGTRHMVVQYNHHGVRAGLMKLYFAMYPQQVYLNYDLRMRLDNTAQARVANKQILTKLRFKVAPVLMNAAQRNAGVSLRRAIELNDQVGGQTIEVTISAGRGHNAMLDNQVTRGLIQRLSRLVDHGVQTGNELVTALRVYGKDSPVDPAEPIDLLASKLEQRIDGLELGNDLRYTRVSRYASLVRARNGWQNVI